MFLKLRVKAALAKFIVTNNCSAETLQFFEEGLIDSFLFTIDFHKFDPNQGAVVVITGTAARGALSGALEKIRVMRPTLYRDLNVLWDYCGALVQQDEARWLPAITVGELQWNPFDPPKDARQDPKHSIQQICEQLGDSSNSIMDAAAGSNELDVAMLGAGAITSIIQAANEAFGIQVRPGTIFASYMDALQQQDIATMVKMAKEMGDALSQVSTTEHRGALIHSWLNGQP